MKVELNGVSCMSLETAGMVTHCSVSPLGAGPLISGFDRHPMTGSRRIQAGGELSWRAEVQRWLNNGRW